MGKAYVWRAAVIAAGLNLVLNPAVLWVETWGLDFVPVARILLYLAVATMALCVLTSTVGAHRLHHEMRTGHRTFHGGTAEEKHFLAGFPSNPWTFGLSMGAFLGALACLAIVTAGLLGFHGFAYGTFVTFIGAYSAGMAFLTMRWTIVRQLMEAATLVG